MKNTAIIMAALAAAAVVAVVAYISLRGKSAAKTAAKPVLTTPSWNASHPPVVYGTGVDKAAVLASISASGAAALNTPDVIRGNANSGGVLILSGPGILSA